MSVNVSIQSLVRVIARRYDPDAVLSDEFSIDQPIRLTGAVPIKGVPQQVNASKLWARELTLAANTPVTLDLSSLSDGRGDTSFSDVTLLSVFNIEDPIANPGRVCFLGDGTGFGTGDGDSPIVGEANSAAWYAAFGKLGSVVAVPAGTARTFYVRTATGWSVGTRHQLKLDPDVGPCRVLVVIGGH